MRLIKVIIMFLLNTWGQNYLASAFAAKNLEIVCPPKRNMSWQWWLIWFVISKLSKRLGSGGSLNN